MLTTSQDTGADNWWLVVVGWWLVVGGWWWWWLVVGGWWLVVGGWWLVEVEVEVEVVGVVEVVVVVVPGRASHPLESTKCCTCHANHSGTAAEPSDARRHIERAGERWHLFGDSWLVTISWWQLVGSNWWVEIGW